MSKKKKKTELPKLTLKEVKNLPNAITIKGIKASIKNLPAKNIPGTILQVRSNFQRSDSQTNTNSCR